MTFNIRKATEKDYAAVCALFAEGDGMHREALPHVFRDPGAPARTKEFFTETIKNSDAVLFVAEQDGKLIGMIHAVLRSAPAIPLFVPRRYAVIDNVVVEESHRRSGIGAALMEHVHRWAFEKGVTQVELNVWEFNEGAIAFYEKLGYTTASRKMWKTLEEGGGRR
ncbi:MAG: GNAT family N-acetyltransferase [Planctomycetota bacterium]